MKEIPAPNLQSVSPVHVQFGKVIPAQQQILLYNFSDWEDFVHEWVNSQRSKYLQVDIQTKKDYMEFGIISNANTIKTP